MMNQIFKSLSILLASVSSFSFAEKLNMEIKQGFPEKKYNVLIITVDDMRDYVGYLGGYGGLVHTPNIDRLASQGVAFTNAHTSASVCCPSRNAMLSGKRPSTTGLYNNSQWWKAALPGLITMPQFFKENGYYSAGAGKVFHHTPGNNPPVCWNEYQDQVFDNPWNFAKWKPERYFIDYGYRGPIMPFPDWKPLNGIESSNAAMDWGAIPGLAEADYGDVQIVTYARDFLHKKHEKPFFLALGTFRPHIPWHIPQKYIDMYPIETIVLPETKDDDLEDIPPVGRKLALKGQDYVQIKEAGKLKEAIQAYLASITFADQQIGSILQALKESEYADNTIVVFWSDHGWHFGTKQHWHKQTLWEECTRIPFTIKVPGVTRPNSVCEQPVDMVNVFPTLLSLCNLPPLAGLDGHDMSLLLTNPRATWEYPAITEIEEGNVAVRSKAWRYIRYHDGGEELYDRRNDPNEWNNLARSEKSRRVIDIHRKWIPEKFAPAAPGKENYFFDPYAYTFMHRTSGVFIDGNK